MRRTPAVALIAVFALAPAACAKRPVGPATPSGPAVDAVTRLRADLAQIFDDPSFVLSQWGVEVASLDRGEILYSKNAAKLYMPASNNKVLTSAVALVRLGPDFRFETRLSAEGSVSDGVLRGDLWVTGTGDPSAAPRFNGGDPFKTFRDWAALLRERGIRRIVGDLVGDDRAFEETTLGSGWEWDDLAYGYAAPVSALQFNESLVNLEITPAAPGEAATVKQMPLADYLSVDAKVLTVPAGEETQIEIDRAETGESTRIRGTVQAGAGPVTRTAAVRHPTRYYLAALRQVLNAEGVECSPCDAKHADRLVPAPENTPLLTHRSPPLSDILKPLLKVSQNLYAETLARTLGLMLRREGSFLKGREVVEETLRNMAVEKGTYLYADGSGLSRLNLVSADVLVRIFKYMYRHKYSAIFLDALPIAGVDGTISGRMQGTRAENNVHAKTGTIAYVRSLSGYVRTADGETLVFSIIGNNFLASSRAAEYVQDTALERLANFSRK